jgi:hypothetical protein
MPANDVTVTATFRVTTAQTQWEAALKLIEAATFTVAQSQANTESDLRYALATLINELIKETGFTVSASDIVIFVFSPAVSGKDDTPDGVNGTFQFRVSPSNVRNSAYSSGVITASPVNNDVIASLRSNLLKAWMQNATLYITGLTQGKLWYIYNLYGQLIYTGIATTDKAEIA